MKKIGSFSLSMYGNSKYFWTALALDVFSLQVTPYIHAAWTDTFGVRVEWMMVVLVVPYISLISINGALQVDFVWKPWLGKIVTVLQTTFTYLQIRFLHRTRCDLFQASLKFIPNGSVSTVLTLVQINAWSWNGKPLCETIMVEFTSRAYMCLSASWVKSWH